MLWPNLFDLSTNLSDLSTTFYHFIGVNNMKSEQDHVTARLEPSEMKLESAYPISGFESLNTAYSVMSSVGVNVYAASVERLAP